MNEWVTDKPDFKSECLVIAATDWRTGWEYDVYQIKFIDDGDGKYLAWLDRNAEEYGDLADFRADKYFVMPLLKN